MSKASTEETAARLACEIGIAVEQVLHVIWARDSQFVVALMRVTSWSQYGSLEEWYLKGRVPVLDRDFGVSAQIVARVLRTRDTQYARALSRAISQEDYDALIVRFFPPDRAKLPRRWSTAN